MSRGRAGREREGRGWGGVGGVRQDERGESLL